MTDRIIKVREQGKLVLRGLTPYEGGARITLDFDDRLDLTVDWSDWLGGDTIASVTNEDNSAAVDQASNTTTTATLWVKGYTGRIEHRITTAGGRTKELSIYVVSSGTADYWGSRYYG